MAVRHGQFLRILLPGFSMKKWPGYVADSGRMRFQRRIPEDVRHAFGGRSHIRFPLTGTTSQEAKRSALAWYVVYEEVFAEVRGRMEAGTSQPSPAPSVKPLSAYTPEELRALIEPVADGMDRHQHDAIASGGASYDALFTRHAKLDRAVRDVLSGKGSDYLGILSGLFLAARGIPCDTREALTWFMFEHARVLQARTVAPGGRRLDGEYVEPAPLPPAPKMGAGLMIPAPEKPRGLTLGTVTSRWSETLSPNQYRRKLLLCVDLFVECVGADTPVKDLKQTHIQDFLLTVCRLPRGAGGRFRQKGASLAELLADEDSERLAEKTYIDSYRATLKRFIEDSVRDYGDQGFPHRQTNYPYTGTRTGVQDMQRHLEEHELRRLFEGPEFAAVAVDPAQAHLYWLAVIGLYTGARPREICQLNPQCDWGKTEGVWYLTFDENTPAGAEVKKTIKTGEKRFVPLHPELVRLGLPEHLQQLKDGGADRMFPGVRVKKGNPYEVVQEEFTALLKATGLYDNQTVGAMVLGYYVFRKTFATYGDEQHINVAPFVGHREAGKTVTQKHYITRPKRVPWLYERFKELAYPVAIPMPSQGPVVVTWKRRRKGA